MESPRTPYNSAEACLALGPKDGGHWTWHRVRCRPRVTCNSVDALSWGRRGGVGPSIATTTTELERKHEYFETVGLASDLQFYPKGGPRVMFVPPRWALSLQTLAPPTSLPCRYN